MRAAKLPASLFPDFYSLMYNYPMPAAVDYLVIGHLTQDLTPQGARLGGTAAYSALTAHALGLRVGVVTAWGGELPLDLLTGRDGITISLVPTPHTTTFENVYTPAGRVQYLHRAAPRIEYSQVPQEWRRTPIIHVGPIAQEVSPLLPDGFSPELFCLTPQGWLRTWDGDQRVFPCPWPDMQAALPKASAAVISVEDVGGDESQIEAMALACRVLAVTEGPAGARLYWNGDLRRFRAPAVPEADATGAGDIFAAAFFFRLYATRDPWEAARFATRLASFSVAQPGLAGIPTREEIQACLVEVI
jgi:sugar/nucleoside kinase (ribokinase family)